MTPSTAHGANRRMQSPPLIPDASGGHRHFPPAICPAVTKKCPPRAIREKNIHGRDEYRVPAPLTHTCDTALEPAL